MDDVAGLFLPGLNPFIDVLSATEKALANISTAKHWLEVLEKETPDKPAIVARAIYYIGQDLALLDERLRCIKAKAVVYI